MPNLDQITSLIRAVLVIIGTLLASSGNPLSDSWTSISGIILLIIPIVWAMFVHSDTGKLKSVEKLDDVKSIVPINQPNPNSAVAIASASPDHPKVV